MHEKDAHNANVHQENYQRCCQRPPSSSEFQREAPYCKEIFPSVKAEFIAEMRKRSVLRASHCRFTNPPSHSYFLPHIPMSLLHPGKVDAPSLHVLLAHELKDLYDAEQQIIDALPKVIDQTTDLELKKALEEHLRETENHVTRLEDCFNMLDMKPERVHCDGMAGVLKEGDHVLSGKMDEGVKDDALIGACQRVEHYEMAAYGCAREHAKVLGFAEIAKLLDETLQEEGKADHTLTEIAKKMHKVPAMAK